MADPANGGRDLSGIEYALVWKQDPALFERAKDVKAIFSGGAGVDHILRVGGLPEHVTARRFVDRSLTDRMSEWVVLQCCCICANAGLSARAAQRHWEDLAQPEARDVTVGVMVPGVSRTGRGAQTEVHGLPCRRWSRTPRRSKACRHSMVMAQ